MQTQDGRDRQVIDLDVRPESIVTVRPGSIVRCLGTLFKAEVVQTSEFVWNTSVYFTTLNSRVEEYNKATELHRKISETRAAISPEYGEYIQHLRPVQGYAAAHPIIDWLEMMLDKTPLHIK